MKRHINIPIFIPHVGCNNACVFCNQRRISGKTVFDINSVASELERAAATIDYGSCNVEIAYFGGSFTGIDRGDMLYLLKLAQKYISQGKAQSVRISTRPDYINDEILDVLSEHGVTDIELGLQSMSDDVLLASKRGHTSECARNACRLIKSRDEFTLVGQMMIGLPQSTLKKELETACEIAELCDAARIYPTVVFCETELCDMMNADGERHYSPLTMGDAVRRSEEVLNIFIKNNIPVIRLGLCAADNLFEPGTMVGGAYHSAFGELVYSEHYYRVIREYIETNQLREDMRGKNITIYVPIGETSKVSGQKRTNKLRLQNEYNVNNVKIVESSELFWYNIKIGIN
ncbi:MAG: radical SAM protein [Clostridiales bacterium]|nr:radical SAM protein [Clostridiales bacterium]